MVQRVYLIEPLMVGKKYSPEDFRIGESVIPLAHRELTFVVIDIDREKGLIICGIPEAPGIKGKYKPDELEKKRILRPPNIVDFDISESE